MIDTLRKISLDKVNDEELKQVKLPKLYLFIRRIIEILVILILSPFIIILGIIIAIVIFIELKENVLFVQDRPGRNGSTFKIFKFRSMTNHVSEKTHGYYHEAYRITKVGRFIRKHRIDEIPQFWNVLKGEMSLIGPRPEPMVYYNLCVDNIPIYRYRYKIAPGITGLAQVSFHHTDNIEEAATKLEYDLYYLSNISPKLDLEILFKTFYVIFTGKGGR